MQGLRLALCDPDVRFGSKADLCSATTHVRFTPDNDIDCVFRHIQSAKPRSTAGGFTEIMCSLRQAPGGKPGTLAKRRARERPRSHYHRAGNDRRRIAIGTDRNARAIAIPVNL